MSFSILHIHVAKLIRIFLQTRRGSLTLGKENFPHVGNVKIIYIDFSNVRKSLTPIVKCVNICPSLFQSFSAKDLQRLKNNDKWLTDSHITFGLLLVPIFFGIDLHKHLFIFPGTAMKTSPRKVFGVT